MDAMYIGFQETFSIGYVRSIVMRLYKGNTVLNPVIYMCKRSGVDFPKLFRPKFTDKTYIVWSKINCKYDI
jgi:hypothetical protein